MKEGLGRDRKITGILGVGNLLLGDEGFGVHVVNYLQEHCRLPSDVHLLDGGTAGIYMAPFFEEIDHLIVVDVVSIDAPPGSIYIFTGDELKGANAQLRMSPHQLGILEVLEICKLREQAPEWVEFIGVVPANIQTGMTLSDTLVGRVGEVAGMIVDKLAAPG